MDSYYRPSLRREPSTGESTISTDSHPSRTLLFGEIPSTVSLLSSRSLRSNNSVCNLVLSSNQPFLRFWLSEECREAFLSSVDKTTLPNLRLVCHDFAAKAAPRTFRDAKINFKSSTFTKLGRMTALKKIGHHFRNLTFRMPHTSETFLPPLLDPFTGEQRSFTYVPQVERPSSSSSGHAKQPKYGTQEMTDLLVEQYPPIFHAATNIPAFIRAFSSMPHLAHIKISCPGQDAYQRYLRSTVDYALISLRIAIERSPLYELQKLSLDSIHPSALFYLQPIMGIGSSPGSHRRWAQVRNLDVQMISFPFDDPNRTEHLRILHAYLRAFSPNLTDLSFRWIGKSKGPSPLSLDREPVLQSITPPSTPERGAAPPRSPRALRFRSLRNLLLENAIMDSSQVAMFISRHRRTLVEFSFEEITLRSGDWDHALEPLEKLRRGKQLPVTPSRTQHSVESMNVPCILSPVEARGDDRIVGTLEPQEEGSGGHSLGRWLNRRKGNSRKQSTKEWSGSDHLRKMIGLWR
ncbi:hypothetical protein E2P81_ATG01008 [Venturia nashicola]|uniref:Uncharacterized protein n=1 Tax=Venturia nashicola TaxID=86259 RepID=A0A4Z1PAW8_9PEZI|nr:hypothetical protein E6O75_ATG01031 [Venturia nashicola]TLD38465.1 hypothetical protein E2P81_ATG01008 [Venturia nashicola]